MTERLYEDIVKHITEVMEQYVTPSCSGCAGSTETLKHGIKQTMTSLIPEVQDVEGIDDLESNVMPYYSNMDPFGDHDFNIEEDNT